MSNWPTLALAGLGLILLAAGETIRHWERTQFATLTHTE